MTTEPVSGEIPTLQETGLVLIVGRDVRQAEHIFRGLAAKEPGLWGYRIKVVAPDSYGIAGLRPSRIFWCNRASMHRLARPFRESIDGLAEIMGIEVEEV